MTEVYTSDAHRAAVDYRNRGWSPIPLKPRSKEPKLKKDHPFLSRRATDDEFADFDFRHNVGIVAGRVSGVIVLDDDDGGETLRKNGWHVPATATVKTRRGHQHYFRCPDGGLPTFDVAGKLEVRGDGAYVVAPPSIHPSGAVYEWVIPPDEAELADPPEWIIERASLRGRRMRAEDVGETISNGSRNKTLFSIAGTLRRRALDEASIAAALLGINATKCATPLEEDEVRKIARSAARYEPGDPYPPSPLDAHEEPAPNGHLPERRRTLTDLGNAERFVDEHGDRVRYCGPWNDWLVYDGTRWVRDATGEVERLMKTTARGIYAEAAAEEDDKARKALDDHARRSESAKRISDALRLARSEPGIPILPGQLDADPWLLNVENGTVDLRKGELREHRREDMLTKLAPIKYDPAARTPRFERFLHEVFDGDDELIAFLRRFAGYTLTGSTEERAFAILHGRGKNGKSTFVELMQEAMGDYATTTDTETILAKRYQGVGNDVAALKGARFVAAAEVERDRHLAESKVKQLTGSDTVTARFLYGEPFSFRPEFKLWLSTNNKPVIRGTDDAIWDRIRIVPFEQRFVGDRCDSKLPEKLRAELPGVLAWMVRGCVEWRRAGLGDPDRVRAATEGYRAEMDTLAGFIDECCVTHPDSWCKFADLYEAYTAWCEESKERPEKKRRFADSLTERGFEKDNGPGNVAIRSGIALRHDGDPDPSRVNDLDPKSGPESPDPTDHSEEVINAVNERDEIVNPQNTCKDEVFEDVVNEGYRKYDNSVFIPHREGGSRKNVNVVNSLTTREDAEPPSTARGGDSAARKHPVEEKARELKARELRLIREGMTPRWARKTVLAGDHRLDCACEVCA